MSVAPRASGARPAGGTILFGGSGFLGTEILRRHPDIVSVGRTPPSVPAEHVQVEDVGDLESLQGLPFENVIFAVGNSDRPAMTKGRSGGATPVEHHVVPLVRVLEELKGFGPKRFVRFSTMLLYDERAELPIAEDAPIDPYRDPYVLSQRLAEEVCRHYGRDTPIVNVRMSNMYGPSTRRRYDVIWSTVSQLVDKGRAELTSLEPERDFIYVGDAADASVELARSQFAGTVNLGTGISSSLGEVANVLERVSGGTVVDRGESFSGPRSIRCDVAVLRQAIDWRPQYSLAEGLELTYRGMAEGRPGEDMRASA